MALNKNGDKSSRFFPAWGMLLALSSCFFPSAAAAEEIKVRFFDIELPDIFGTKKEEPPAPKKVRSYKDGLEMLAAEIPFDVAKARYGRFEPADPKEQTFRYLRPRIEHLSGQGWLAETNGQTVFWLDAIQPIIVELDKKTPGNPNAVAGKFKPVDWRKDLPKIEKELASKQPEEMLYTGASASLVITAAILNAQGEAEIANRLAALALRASREARTDSAQLVSATAINSIAEARYSLAMDRDASLDLAALRGELAEILKRYDGCFYYAAPVRELERNIAATLDSKQKPSPFVTWKYAKVDEQLLASISGNFWVLWNPEVLSKQENSPIATLAMRGVEAIPELQAMLADNRVTTLVRGETRSGVHRYQPRGRTSSNYYDIRGLTKAPTGMDLQERINRFAPCPATVREIALAMLAGLFPSAPQYGGVPTDEPSLAEKAAAFYAKYKGLSGSNLAAAIIDSDDTALKVAMLSSLMESDPKFLAPLLLKYVQNDPPGEMMLQLVMLISRKPAEAGPIIEAFLARAPNSTDLAQMISAAAGQQDNPEYAKQVLAQIDRLHLTSKPATPDMVVEQIIRNSLDFDVLQTGLTKVDPAPLAKSYMAHMTASSSPKQIDALLLYLVRAKTMGGEMMEGKDGEKMKAFLKALLAERKSWEAIFADKRRGQWAVLGESAVSVAYGLGVSDFNYARSLPAFGGERLLQWMKKGLEAYWTSNTPLPNIPDGKELEQPALDKLAAEAMAAPDLGEWLRNLPLEQAVAIPIVAGKNAELAKRLRPIATKIGQVEVHAPAGAVVDKIRALEGQTLTVDALMDVLAANLAEDLSLIFTRTDVPGPITIVVTKRPPNEAESTERMLTYLGFQSGMEELRMEPTYLGTYPDLKDSFKEADTAIRQLLEPEIGPEGTGIGFFWIHYGPDVSEN